MALYDQENEDGNRYRVKLVTQRTARNGPSSQERVIFNVTPEFSESRTVNYSTIDPVHMPGQIYVYKNTSARTYSISAAKLISRTQEEAEINLNYLWLLRSWQMPRFGVKSSTINKEQRNVRVAQRSNDGELDTEERQKILSKAGVELLGSPPPVLYLSAYSQGSGGNQSAKREHINRVPVVIQSLNIPYPSDVDYIMSTTGVPMPTIMAVDVQLMETHSAREYEQFSLSQYKAGILPHF